MYVLIYRYKVNKLKNNVCFILLIIKILYWMLELDYYMYICVEGIIFYYYVVYVCNFILKIIIRYKIMYKFIIFYRLKFYKIL